MELCGLRVSGAWATGISCIRWRSRCTCGRRSGFPRAWAFSDRYLRPDTERWERAGRGDRVARVSGAGAVADDVVYGDGANQRRGLVALALSHSDLWGLQRGYADLVWVDVFYGDGHRRKFCVCVDAIEERQLVDGRDSSWKPQSVYPGDFHATNAQHGEDGVVHRRIWGDASAGGDWVRVLFLVAAGGTAERAATERRQARGVATGFRGLSFS